MKRFFGMFAIALCVVLTGCPDSKGNPTESTSSKKTVVGTWERTVNQLSGDPSKTYITFEQNGNWKFTESHSSGEYFGEGTYSILIITEGREEKIELRALASNHPKIRVGHTYEGTFSPGNEFRADFLDVKINGLPNTAWNHPKWIRVE